MADIYNLGDSNFGTANPLNGGKSQHDLNLVHSQTGTIVAATEYLTIVRGATATVLSIEAAIQEAVATGADRTATIDLQKSTGGGAYATILSSTIVFNNGSTLRAITTGSISSNSLVDGDMLKITVAVAGAAGAQATGLCVTVRIREAP